MTKKIIATAMWVAFLLGIAVAPYAMADQPAKKGIVKSAKKRIVIHVTEDSPQKWNMVLNNAGNVQDALGKDNVQIEIVTHGPGINMLKMESVVGERMKTALANGVNLVACEFTMRAAKVTKDDMYAGISYAPSGVTRILEREAEGWFYLRP